MTRPGYKMTEIGEIPGEWDSIKIEDPKVTEKMKAGGTPLKSVDNYYKNGTIPFVKIEDIVNSSKYLTRTLEFITDDGLNNSSTWLTPKDSILFSMYASYGEVCINKIPVATNQAIMSIVPTKENVDVTFLYYELKNLKNSLKQYLRSTTQNNLNAEIVKGLKIVLPPLPEQQKIAEILSTADDAIQRVDEQITLSERLKKGLMQTLLTKGIGHMKFKVTEIGEIPEEWKVVKLGEIIEFQYGITASASTENSGIHLLRITDIKDAGVKWEEIPFCKVNKAYIEKYKLNAGDVLIARIGATTGKSCYVDRSVEGVFGSYLIRLKPRIKLINKFLYFLTKSSLYWNQVNKMKEGQLKKGINTKLLGNLLILVPPLPEQQKIAEILLTVDEKLGLLKGRRDHLEKLKKVLMNDLLTGKVRVKIEPSRGEN